MGIHQLLKEQAREFICGKLGHTWKFVLPLQTRPETREVLCGCPTCEEKEWKQVPEQAYQQIMKDYAEGKLK